MFCHLVEKVVGICRIVCHLSVFRGELCRSGGIRRLLGALYLIVLVSGQLLNMLCVFLAICQCCDVSDFLQAVKEGKNIIVLQVCGVCVKLLVIFALLRVLTTLI